MQALAILADCGLPKERTYVTGSPPGYPLDMNEEFTLEDVAFLLCRGGWPIAVQAPRDIALEITKNYYGGLFIFEDTSIARRSLGVNLLDLMNDLESFGLFFEDFAVRDLRVYDSLGGEVKHYRTTSRARTAERV